MKIRTFLIILAALGIVFPIASLFDSNRVLLNEPILLWGDFVLPVKGALLVFFVIGAVVVLLLGGAREVARTWEHCAYGAPPPQ